MNPGDQLFNPLNPLYSLRRQFVRTLAVIGMVIALSGLVGSFAASGGSPSTFPIVVISALAIICGVALSLTNQGRLEIAANLLVMTFVVATIATTVNNFMIGLIIGMVAMTSAATLATGFQFTVAVLIVLGAFGLRLAEVVNTFGMETQEEGIQLVAIMCALLIAGAITRYFVTTIERTAGSQARAVRLLSATAEVGEITAKLLALDELFMRSVELIRDRFAFYHVQVFLVDERREYANLVASTGDVGQKLLARKHRLRVGSQSVIGRVTQVGEPVISRDTDSDNVHAMNELLPNTRAELALPIIENDTIIGALDVQSTRPNAFDGVDIQALQIMANQLATAIGNARLFGEQQKNVEDNRRLFLEAERERGKAERLNSQLTRAAWGEYLQQKREIQGVTVQDGQVQEDAEWSKTMRQAVTKKRVISVEDNGERIIAVPVELRGETLGVIEIRTDPTGDPGEKISMLANVAQRLATTIDNIRLFDEAQMATAQESRINEIVGAYQTADSIEDLLKVTLSELGKTLSAESGAIRLGVSPADRGVRPPGTGRLTGNGSSTTNGSATS